MLECPELAVLEGDATSVVRAHLAACSSCRVVVELLDERRRGVDARDRHDECARFEMLLAARDEGTIGGTAGAMLEAHLRECADCQAVAATLPPASERREHSELPPVSTAAYALGREVARGGMGRILEALDVRIGRPVAVKELLGKAPSLAARFEREARVTARLQHPGIVPIYEIGKWPDGTPFYAMRMVEGRTLREAIRDKKTLDDRLALLPAVIAAAEAVAFAHGKRIIHRDLTPNNILVGEYGDTVVIDWGLAKDLSAVSAPDDDVVAGPYRDEPPTGGNLTNVGAVIGTAAYMPPEQANGAVVDERADVYAIGAILYHLLAGDAPYRASKSDEVVRRVQAGPPPEIADISPTAPRDLHSIVDKAMSRDPASRYANAGELAGELRKFQMGQVVSAHTYTVGERAIRWMRSHRALVIGIVTAILSATAVGVVGIVGVLHERDAAEAGQHEAHKASTTLLGELGRQELLAGHSERAAALLSAAYSGGDDSRALRFLLRTALLDVDSIERVLHGDRSPIRRVAFSADGQWLLAVHESVVEQWSIRDGAPRARLVDGDARMVFASFSGDAGRVVAFGGDPFLRVWDAQSGRLIRKLELPELRVAALTSDGTTIFTIQQDGIAKRWDTASGALLDQVHVGIIGQSGWAMPASAYLMAPQRDGRVVLWDWERETRPIPADLGWRPAELREVDRGGTRVVACANIFTNVYDHDGHLIRALRTNRISVTCSLDEAGARVMTVDIAGIATIWDVVTGEVIAELPAGDGPTGAVFAGPGRMLTMSPFAPVMTVRDSTTGTVLASYSRTMLAPPAFSPDGAYRLALPRDDGEIAIVRIGSGRLRGRFSRREHPGHSIAAVTGDRLLTRDGVIAKLWDLTRSSAIATFTWPAAMSDNGTRAVGMLGDTAVVVDARSGAAVAKVVVGQWPDTIDIDQDGTRLISTRAGEPAIVWDIASGKQLGSTPPVAKDAWVSVGPGGRYAVELRQFHPLVVHSLDGGATRTFGRQVFGAGFSSDGRRLAWVDVTDTAGNATRVVDLATGEQIFENMADTASFAFDRGGDLLAISGGDGIRVWRVSTRKLVASTTASAVPESMGIAMTSDGSLLATGAGVWSLDGRQLAALTPKTLGPHNTTNQDGKPDVGWDLGRTVISWDDRLAVSYSDRGDVVLWDISLETRSAAEVAALVDERVPWRVEAGGLVARH